MSVALALPTVDPRSFLTSVWGSFVSTAAPDAIPSLPRTRSGPADAHKTPRAPRGCATSSVGHGHAALQSRAP